MTTNSESAYGPDLSVNAKLVAGSTFGFSPGASIRYQMVESIPSPEMQEALDELVCHAIVTREDEPGGAVKYTASSDIDFMPYRKFAWEQMQSDDGPSVRIFIPNPARKGRSTE
jgi:hypothetical protein